MDEPFVISNNNLCQFIWNHRSSKKDRIDNLLDHVKSIRTFSDSQLPIVRQSLLNFLVKYDNKWQSVSRKKETFLTKKDTKKFLEKNTTVQFKENCDNNVSEIRNTNKRNEAPKRGRKRVSFTDGSISTKKRRSHEIADQYSQEELESALTILEKRPSLENNNIVELDSSEDEAADISQLEIDKSLAMYIDTHLSVRKYENLRTHNKRMFGQKMYPNYKKIQQGKNMCFPENITVNDLGANVPIISLLIHTTKRVIMAFSEDKFKSISGAQLELVGKWGMDGSSGQQTTRQRWNIDKNNSSDADKLNEDSLDDGYLDDDEPFVVENDEVSTDNVNNSLPQQNIDKYLPDKAVFIISFVPLALKANGNMVWINELPNSVHYCRPIKFEFLKEEDKYVLDQYKYYSDILYMEKTYNFSFRDTFFNINFSLKCTMIDGKICNVLTGQKASNCCNICGVGPKYLNNLENIQQRSCNMNFAKFGLSTLHFWIRSLEYMLHVAYRFNPEDGCKLKTKEEVIDRKKKLQIALRKDLQLPVDVVKQGAGTSNTGNLAREFFDKADHVSVITALDKNLLHRLHNILQALTCGEAINCLKFKEYCNETAKICIKLYPWYKIPPSVHKILIHGSDIIKTFQLPMAFYSEEPQEANNKIFRKARAENSRMTSRDQTNEDIIHNMLVLSDPYIASLRVKEKRKKKILSKEAQTLLISEQ